MQPRSLLRSLFRGEKGRIPLLILIPVLGVIIGALVLWLVILKLRSHKGKGFIEMPPPIATIWSMYESASRGDIEGYLESFLPEAQSAIKETLRSQGEEGFKEYLRNKASGLLGVSVISTGPDSLLTDTTDEGVIYLPVEIVFQKGNERQVFTLKPVGKTWKILGVSPPVLTPQPIPYGRDVNQ